MSNEPHDQNATPNTAQTDDAQGFTMIDNRVLLDSRIGAKCPLGLYIMMRKFAWKSGGEICKASQATLAELCQVEPRSVRRWLETLEGVGLVERIGAYDPTSGRTNWYRVPVNPDELSYCLPAEATKSLRTPESIGNGGSGQGSPQAPDAGVHNLRTEESYKEYDSKNIKQANPDGGGDALPGRPAADGNSNDNDNGNDERQRRLNSDDAVGDLLNEKIGFSLKIWQQFKEKQPFLSGLPLGEASLLIDYVRENATTSPAKFLHHILSTSTESEVRSIIDQMTPDPPPKISAEDAGARNWMIVRRERRIEHEVLAELIRKWKGVKPNDPKKVCEMFCDLGIPVAAELIRQISNKDDDDLVKVIVEQIEKVAFRPLMAIIKSSLDYGPYPSEWLMSEWAQHAYTIIGLGDERLDESIKRENLDPAKTKFDLHGRLSVSIAERKDLRPFLTLDLVHADEIEEVRSA